MAILRTLHTGLTVGDLEHMRSFFVACLGAEACEIRQIPPGETLGHIIGVPGAQARVVMVRLPGGHEVELLEYSAPESTARVAPRPCDIGGAHLALEVDSLAATLRAAQPYGFTLAGQVQCLPGGPFAGRHVAYMRDAHGFTLELVGGP